METKTVTHTPISMFETMLRAMPAFLTQGLDYGQHKTVKDLAWMVQHEIDLYEEGEESDIRRVGEINDARAWLKILTSVNSHEAYENVRAEMQARLDVGCGADPHELKAWLKAIAQAEAKV